jgi:hypothetical protein
MGTILMGLDSSLRWLNAKELMKKWEISNFELANLILNHGLPAYFNDLKPVDIQKFKKEIDEHYKDYDESAERSPRIYVDIDFVMEKLENYVFKYSEIENFVKGDSTKEQVSNLRSYQRHRERCRALADYFWKENPKIKIAHMIIKNEIITIGCEGEKYTQNTLRKWINDLCPERKSGRPKKE